MAQEIERKYLVKDASILEGKEGKLYKQGYFDCKYPIIRARIAGDKAYITLKGSPEGNIREEFEYEIPIKDAEYMLEHLTQKPLIEKHRYLINHEGFTWEVDVFHGENEGLILAEIELDEPDSEFPLPSWSGEEVSDDPRYYNANLFKNPYSRWGSK